MRRGLMTMAAGALICAPAAGRLAQDDAQDERDWAAEHAARLVKSGAWRMSATRKGPDGQPECTEIWHFAADGTGRIESGEERIATTWRTERGEGDTWLFTRSLASNGAPDCMGKTRDPASFPREGRGVLLIFFNGGDAILCKPTYAENPDGSLTPTHVLSEDNCWGRLAPIPAN